MNRDANIEDTPSGRASVGSMSANEKYELRLQNMVHGHFEEHSFLKRSRSVPNILLKFDYESRITAVLAVQAESSSSNSKMRL